MMKCRNLAGIAAAIALIATQANAALLGPGGSSPTVFEPDPVGGVTQASLAAPFSYASFSGTLFSTVISGDAANTLGGLTFTYRFNLDASSPQSASAFTISSFAGFLTDMSYYSSGALPVTTPTEFTRSVNGQVVRFLFGGEVAPGQETALLVVQTDASAFVHTSAGIINGGTVNVPSFAPAVIPEPTVSALGLLGLVGFLLRRKP